MHPASRVAPCFPRGNARACSSHARSARSKCLWRSSRCILSSRTCSGSCSLERVAPGGAVGDEALLADGTRGTGGAGAMLGAGAMFGASVTGSGLASGGALKERWKGSQRAPIRDAH